MLELIEQNPLLPVVYHSILSSCLVLSKADSLMECLLNQVWKFRPCIINTCCGVGWNYEHGVRNSHAILSRTTRRVKGCNQYWNWDCKSESESETVQLALLVSVWVWIWEERISHNKPNNCAPESRWSPQSEEGKPGWSFVVAGCSTKWLSNEIKTDTHLANC